MSIIFRALSQKTWIIDPFLNMLSAKLKKMHQLSKIFYHFSIIFFLYFTLCNFFIQKSINTYFYAINKKRPKGFPGRIGAQLTQCIFCFYNLPGVTSALTLLSPRAMTLSRLTPPHLQVRGSAPIIPYYLFLITYSFVKKRLRLKKIFQAGVRIG